MPTVTYEGKQYTLATGESILACLLRHGIHYPFSCNSGICQSCLIKATSGNVEPAWQKNIQDTLKPQQYLLACIAKPSSDITVIAPNTAECEFPADIVHLAYLTDNILQVRLHTDSLLLWTPGKYINVINPTGLTRSYSIANVPGIDGYIELHIRLYPTGAMSTFFTEKAVLGNTIKIRGPLGSCFYHNPEKSSFNMLLVGTGTGLAPLVAIARDALLQEHPGKITLLHGGKTERDLYYVEQLTQLAKQHPNFIYENCVLQSDHNSANNVMPIETKMLQHLTAPRDTKLYVCGALETTRKLKTQAFLAGIASSNIFSDTFLPTAIMPVQQPQPLPIN